MAEVSPAGEADSEEEDFPAAEVVLAEAVPAAVGNIFQDSIYLELRNDNYYNGLNFGRYSKRN